MVRLNVHHITYDPIWEVELTWKMHSVFNAIQRTRATPEQYARLTNFMHAVAYEWNRMRQELDVGDIDLRVLKDRK